MRTALLLAVAGLALTGALAAQSPEGAAVQTVAPGNNWVLEEDCTIYAEWDGNVSVVVSRHDDHLDLGVYDPRWHVTHDKVVKVAIAPGDGAAETHDALARRDEEWTGLVADVSDALVDRIAASGALTLTRGKEVMADLDVTGMAFARDKQRACLAALPEDAAMNAADALENAADAADAAADAAEAAAMESLDNGM